MPSANEQAPRARLLIQHPKSQIAVASIGKASSSLNTHHPGPGRGISRATPGMKVKAVSGAAKPKPERQKDARAR